MTLLFCDSFDHYSTTELAKKWTAQDANNRSLISPGDGRTGAAGLKVIGNNGFVSKTLGNYGTLIVGTAFKYSGVQNPSVLMTFYDGGTEQVRLTLNTNGSITVGRAGTALGTTEAALTLNTYAYIEIKVSFSASATVELRFNGTTVLSLSGVDTNVTANTYANTLKLENNGGSNNFFFDDLYVCSTDGALNNNFLGDIKIETIYPNAVGTYNQWAVNSGTGDHYTYVDENPPNSDTDYILTSGVGYIDTYGFSNLVTTSGSIFGLQACVFARKDDAGSRVIEPAYVQGGVLYSGYWPGQSVTNSYLDYTFTMEKNPVTNSPWTITEINNGEFGVKLQS